MGMERTLPNTFSVEIKEEALDFGGGCLDVAVNAAGIQSIDDLLPVRLHSADLPHTR